MLRDLRVATLERRSERMRSIQLDEVRIVDLLKETDCNATWIENRELFSYTYCFLKK